MKNFILKTLSLFVVAALMLCVFAGCGKEPAENSSSASSNVNSLSGGFGTSNKPKISGVSSAWFTSKPTLTWQGLKEGQTAHIVVTDSKGKTVIDKKGLTGDSYTFETALTNGEFYTIKATYTTDSGEKSFSGIYSDGSKVQCISSNTAAKKNYTFDGKISLEVLNNYLSRAMTYSEITVTKGKTEELFNENIRALMSMGVKYVMRGDSSWHQSLEEEKQWPLMKKQLELLHKVDPEIIVEACIFESVTTGVSEIVIPDWVFKAFGQKVEKRNFSYSKMLFDDGYGVNQWANGDSIPDITRLETQMFFYYRACSFIDMGYESFHLGQVRLTGKNDTGNKNWEKLITMIRDYAKKNARRHYVLINAHDPKLNFVDSKGVQMLDFNALPACLKVVAGQTDHAASEDNPQKCYIRLGDGLYKDIKGTSPSGWTTNQYPYLAEFDNSFCFPEQMDKASAVTWGYDEISWYARQPQWYREETIDYMIKTIKSFSPNGHFTVPGSRVTAYTPESTPKNQIYGTYVINSEQYKGDEDFVKKIYNKYHK